MTNHAQASGAAAPRRASHFATTTSDAARTTTAEKTAQSAARGGAPAQLIGALDGLRAIAIIGVVLYHLRPSVLTGGFLGVTVFLVITGFLATRSVTSALDRGAFSYGSYLLKRVVRLLPPVLVIVALTALGTYLVSPSLLPKVQADALPGSLFFGNWSYIFRQVPYFQAAGLPSPLTHLWYLGVVMQFYVVWPLALMAIWRSARTHRSARRRGTALTCVLILASAAVMALLLDPSGDTTRVYYGTDARAAELLAGSLVALALPGSADKDDRRAKTGTGATVLATIVGVVCLAALLAGFVLANGEDPLMYRGGYLAAALVTTALLANVKLPECPLGRALSVAPLRWLGTRSFSVYLVHYPMLILMNPATRTTDVTWWEQALQVILVLLVAEVFYHLVEAPCARFLRHEKDKRRARDIASASVATCLGVAGACAVGALAFAPVDWQALAQERAAILRPELAEEPEAAAPEATAPEDDSSETDSSEATNAPSEPAPEKGDSEKPSKKPEEKPKEPERPVPVAEKVPDNLPWESWSFDPETGTCDARALIIGDSVTEGAAPELRKMLPNALVDGKVSRQLYVGQDVYAADVAGGYDPEVVVFALGGNGLIRDKSTVQALIDVVEGKPMFFVTIRSPLKLQDLNNEILRDFAAENPNVGIIDWCGASEGHSEYLVDDGIHLTGKGMVAFSQLIREALCGQ